MLIIFASSLTGVKTPCDSADEPLQYFRRKSGEDDKGTPPSHRTVLKPGLLQPHRGTPAYTAYYFSPARAVARQQIPLLLDRRPRSSPHPAVALQARGYSWSTRREDSKATLRPVYQASTSRFLFRLLLMLPVIPNPGKAGASRTTAASRRKRTCNAAIRLDYASSAPSPSQGDGSSSRTPLHIAVQRISDLEAQLALRSLELASAARELKLARETEPDALLLSISRVLQLTSLVVPPALADAQQQTSPSLDQRPTCSSHPVSHGHAPSPRPSCSTQDSFTPRSGGSEALARSIDDRTPPSPTTSASALFTASTRLEQDYSWSGSDGDPGSPSRREHNLAPPSPLTWLRPGNGL